MTVANPTGPTFGFVIPAFGPCAEPAAFADLVQAGEELGYADVWFGDHVAVPAYAAHLTSPDWLDPLACCLVGLGRTSRIRFGTDVLVAPYRHPLVLAKLAATADRLTGGRLTLAFGVGYLRGEFAALGVDHRFRGAITDEYLEVLRLAWSSEGKTSFHGSHLSFDDVCFGPRPVQDPMPLWVGGNNPKARQRAAALGTGWHPLFPTPAQYQAGRQTILGLRAGRDEAFTFSFSAAATQLVDRPDGPYVLNTWDEVPDVPADFGYAPPPPLASGDRPRLVGTPDQVAGDVADYVDAGVEHFTLRFAVGTPDVGPAELVEQLRRFAAEVAPRFAADRSGTP